MLRSNRIFDLVLIGCGLFVLLTIIAMFFYPGGTMVDASTVGYSFFHNFFSELGFLNAHGHLNPVSVTLFIPALTLAGLGLGAFFLAFPRFFQGEQAARLLSNIGSLLGLLSAVCFIAIAFIPGDVNLDLHIEFVMWAFRLFPAAVLLYTVAMFRVGYPRRYAWVFVGFFILLVAYLLLLEFGPKIETYSGMVIQAVGQKIIVYASIFSIMAQADGARKQAKSPSD